MADKTQLMERTADALLINFTKPIKEDFCIPDNRGIEKLMYVITLVLDGQFINLENIEKDYFRYHFNSESFKGLPGKIKEGLGYCLSGGYRCNLFTYLKRNGFEKTKRGFGSWDEEYFYKFKPGKKGKLGEKEKALERINSFFNKEELKAMDFLGDLIQIYQDKI